MKYAIRITLSVALVALSGLGAVGHAQTWNISDDHLFSAKASFYVRWDGRVDHDSFEIAGQVNPSGARTNLAGTGMSLSLNSYLVGTVILDESGRGSHAELIPLSMRRTAGAFDSATGKYRFRVSGRELYAILHQPQGSDTTGVAAVDVTLAFQNAGLDTETFHGTLAMPFVGKAVRGSRGRFAAGRDRTPSGVFLSQQASAEQTPAGVVIDVTGVLLSDLNTQGYISPPTNRDPRLQVGETALAFIGWLEPRDSKVLYFEGGRLEINRSRLLLHTKPLANTGLPAPGPGAPLSYRLALVIEYGVFEGVYVFATEIELQRPDSFATIWSR